MLVIAAVALAGCAAGGSAAPPTSSPAGSSPMSTASGATTAGTSPTTAAAATGAPIEFKAEVWADNWFALYVDGRLVGEDSVPITTERSFNAETITFRASYPFTVGMVTKDFKQDDSGLEYIGTPRQQMGDGGFIAQITDTTTGRVVAVTGADWRGLVVHKAPTNKDCAQAIDPTTACRHEIIAEPTGWADPGFDDSAWPTARVYTAQQVDPKDGYDTIRWDPAGALIWTTDLQMDNTILWRHRVEQP